MKVGCLDAVEILANVVINSTLRLNVLNADNDSVDYSDGNFSILNDFVNDTIPDSFGYSLQICPLSSHDNYCKIDTATFIATLDKDIFTEEIMISAELGDGENAIYEPKKVKLYVWEGEVVVDCIDATGCHGKGTFYSCSDDDPSKIFSKTCQDIDTTNVCLEREDGIPEECDSGKICDDSGSVVECVASD